MACPKWLSIKMDPPWMEVFLAGTWPLFLGQASSQLKKNASWLVQKTLDLLAGAFARHLGKMVINSLTHES